MQINANFIVVLIALFVLGFLHDKDLDLNSVALASDIKTIKHKAYLPFHFNPKGMSMSLLDCLLVIRLRMIRSMVFI